MTWARYFTITVPFFFTQEYKKVVAKCQQKGGGEGKNNLGQTYMLSRGRRNAQAGETRIALLI